MKDILYHSPGNAIKVGAYCKVKVQHIRREMQRKEAVLRINDEHGTMSHTLQMVSRIPDLYPFSSVQSLSRVQLFATPWTASRQASLSITNSQSLLKLMCIESVTPSNHLILCLPLLLPPSIFPSIRVFSNESALHIRWPKHWSFSFSISRCS